MRSIQWSCKHRGPSDSIPVVAQVYVVQPMTGASSLIAVGKHSLSLEHMPRTQVVFQKLYICIEDLERIRSTEALCWNLARQIQLHGVLCRRSLRWPDKVPLAALTRAAHGCSGDHFKCGTPHLPGWPSESPQAFQSASLPGMSHRMYMSFQTLWYATGHFFKPEIADDTPPSAKASRWGKPDSKTAFQP